MKPLCLPIGFPTHRYALRFLEATLRVIHKRTYNTAQRMFTYILIAVVLRGCSIQHQKKMNLMPKIVGIFTLLSVVQRKGKLCVCLWNTLADSYGI
jgi:hypothetical protein